MAAAADNATQRLTTVRWPNGDVYEGQCTSTGARTGEGTLVYASGDTYDGGFLEGQYYGRGRLRRAPHWHGGVLHVAQSYTGEFARGKRHGRGVLLVGEGSVYDGEFVAGAFSGRGVMRYADGRVYEGGWWRGLWHGDGQLALACGDTYAGGFASGAFHGGAGLYRYRAGGSYAGAFAAGRRHGVGRRLWASGAEYEGEWADGAMHGRGIYRSAGGDVAVGAFRHGAPHGQATLLFCDGSRYQGTLVRGALCGAGRFTYADGGLYDGEFLAMLRTGVPAAAGASAAQRELRRKAGSLLYVARPWRAAADSDDELGAAPPAWQQPQQPQQQQEARGAPPRGGGAAGGGCLAGGRSASVPTARARAGAAAAAATAPRPRRPRSEAPRAPYDVPAHLRPPALVTGRVLVGSVADAALQASMRGGGGGPHAAAAAGAPPRLAADGMRHGRGLRVWASGARYEGEWFQGLQQGFGVYVGPPPPPPLTRAAAAATPPQQRFEGAWVAGRRCGYGVASFGVDDEGATFVCPLGHAHRGRDGRCVYDGEWEADAFHGAGALTCCDGRQHRGSWRGGQPHGPGRRVALPRSLWAPLPDCADPLSAPALRPSAIIAAAMRPAAGSGAQRIPLDALGRVRVTVGVWASGVQCGAGRALLNRGDVIDRARAIADELPI